MRIQASRINAILMAGSVFMVGCVSGTSDSSAPTPMVTSVDRPSPVNFGDKGSKPNPKEPTGTFDKMTAAVTAGWDRFSTPFATTPKIPPTNDPTRLSSQKPKMDANFHVEVAQLRERQQASTEAIDQYQQALELDQKHLVARLGIAHLLDRQNKLTEATIHYQRATQDHPRSSRAWNDLGLCYVRRQMFEMAEQSLKKSVSLRPDHKLYRNNLAGVLVSRGKSDAAVDVMAGVHGRAVAYYNVGFFLVKQGKSKLARSYFAESLRLNPKSVATKQWLAKIDQSSNSGPLAADGNRQPVDSNRRSQQRFDTVSKKSPRVDSRRQLEVMPIRLPIPIEDLNNSSATENAPLPAHR